MVNTWQVIPLEGVTKKSKITDGNGGDITWNDLRETDIDRSYGSCPSIARVGHSEAESYCVRLNSMEFEK